jgi:hypothetical protein
LGSSANGIFDVPSLQDKFVSAFKGIARPTLLTKLNRGVILGQKIYDHYLQYPPEWDLPAYGTWCEKADLLFRKIGK